MDPWTVGLAVLVVVALVAVVYGALSDRTVNRHAREEMLAPPQRPIPKFSPDAPAPHYLSDLQAHRPPADVGPRDLTDPDRHALRTELDRPGAVTVPAGYASADFVTDQQSEWAVLDDPLVLVCEEPVATVRELLTVMERVLLTAHPLVVAAPDLAADVLATLQVNAIQRRLPLVAVRADRPTLRAIAAATGTEPAARADLQSGYLGADRLGRCARWVSSSRRSHVLPAADPGDPR